MADRPLLPTPALSRELRVLPESVRFQGPSSLTLGAVRFSSPLLLGGWMCALFSQGAFGMLAAAGIAGTTLCTVSGVWLRRRQRRLRAIAKALWRYAERQYGPQHELTIRAKSDTLFLANGLPSNALTLIEERLKYTRELLAFNTNKNPF